MNIDNEILSDILIKYAEKDLKTISTNSIKLYIIDVEDGFKTEFRKAVKDNYNKVKENLSVEQRSRFLDLETGYLPKMVDWLENTQFKFPPLPNFIVKAEPEINDTNELRTFVKSKEGLLIGGATICLLFSGFKIWAIIAEALAIAWGGYKYNDTKNQKEEEKIKRARELEKYISEYLESVKHSAFEWIKDGKQYSDDLLKTY